MDLIGKFFSIVFSLFALIVVAAILGLFLEEGTVDLLAGLAVKAFL